MELNSSSQSVITPHTLCFYRYWAISEWFILIAIWSGVILSILGMSGGHFSSLIKKTWLSWSDHIWISIVDSVSWYWIAVLLHSKKLHNVHVSLHGSIVKQSSMHQSPYECLGHSAERIELCLSKWSLFTARCRAVSLLAFLVVGSQFNLWLSSWTFRNQSLKCFSSTGWH